MWSEAAVVVLLEDVALELSDHPQAWTLLSTILRNIVEHPIESKYRNVNKAKIVSRILSGLKVLELVGFRAEGSTLTLPESCIDRVIHAVGVLDEMKARPLVQLRAQREAAVSRIEQKALSDVRAKRLKPETFKIARPTPQPITKFVARVVDGQRQTAEGLDRELNYLLAKIQTMELKLGILHTLGSHLDFDSGRKMTPPCDFVAQLWKGPLWGVEMMVELLRKLQIDPTTRYLLLKTHLSKFEEAPGSLSLLFNIGYEVKDVALVLPPEQSLSPAHVLLTTLQTRLTEVQQSRNAAKQVALTKITTQVPSVAVEPLSAAVASANLRLRELQEAQSNLKAVMGAPFRIEWTVMGWMGKELTPDTEYPSFPNAEDARGRKWRAYARKSFHNKDRDRIGVFLQCLSSPKILPVKVGMHMSVLHRQSSVECQLLHKDATEFFDLRQFTPEEHTWGYANYSSTQDMLLMGALTSIEDKLTFRVDFCVQE